MNFLGYFILITLLYTFSFSQDEPQASPYDQEESFVNIPSDLESRTSRFFNYILDSNVTAAYNDLFETSYISNQTSKINALINQTHRAIELYGNLRGYEPVNVEHVSPSYIRIRYLGLHTRLPMRWIFTFYKSPENGWVITNVKFDDYSELYFTDE